MKRYYSYSNYLKQKYNGKVRKISVYTGLTCPNRDGTKAFGGCTYCNNKTFVPTYAYSIDSLKTQLEKAISIYSARGIKKYIVYMQAYTNTYTSLKHLEQLVRQASSFKGIVGFSFGTRPDAITLGILTFLNDLGKTYDVWIEFGLETSHDTTLRFINRGHNYRDFLLAYEIARSFSNIKILVHVIMGLPFETKNMMLTTIDRLALLGIDGIKLHNLHIVRGTRMYVDYLQGKFNLSIISISDYLDILAESIARLPKSVVVQRLFATTPKEYLVAPIWGVSNAELYRIIDKHLERRGVYQGMMYSPPYV